MRRLFVCLVVCSACLVSGAVGEDEPDGVVIPGLLSQAGAKLSFERYGPEDGLPHNTVNDITQDSEGFLWFATDDGLARFDGYAFRVFRPRAELAVSPRFYWSSESSDGRLLVTGAEGVLIFDGAESELRFRQSLRSSSYYLFESRKRTRQQKRFRVGGLCAVIAALVARHRIEVPNEQPVNR